jgi:hypothetical protein
MCELEQLLNSPFVKEVLASDFKCGYAAATLVFLLVIISMLFAKLLIFILFRTPKCSEVVVKSESGNLVISSLICKLLEESGRLEDAKVIIREKGKKYLIGIRAAYSEGAVGLPEISEALKPQILDLLKQQFGIENVETIIFSVDRLAEKSEEDADTGF